MLAGLSKKIKENKLDTTKNDYLKIEGFRSYKFTDSDGTILNRIYIDKLGFIDEEEYSDSDRHIQIDQFRQTYSDRPIQSTASTTTTDTVTMSKNKSENISIPEPLSGPKGFVCDNVKIRPKDKFGGTEE